MFHFDQPLRISAPSSRERTYIRFLVVLGVCSVLLFCGWLFEGEHQGYYPLYILFLVSVGYKILRALHEWIHYANIQAPAPPPIDKNWTVDILTTAFPGEPINMIRQTLEAMVAVEYPHTNYLCDEGNDPILKQICEELGVIHVYRGEDKTDAKAGNINYALSHYATGEICVILDPDHVPHPRFLDEVLGFFEDSEIGYVQSIQAYHNRRESLISRGATEQTYQFYGPMMMGMN
ncbi:MAG: glycosyltransferase, partial [Bacteroidota bacterium]